MASPATAAVTSTLRLECSNGKTSSVGTGFLYKIAIDADRHSVFIATNKHVIGGMTHLSTTFSIAPNGSIPVLPDDLRIADVFNVEVQILLNGRVLPHPEADVDLCLINVTPDFIQALNHGQLRHLILDSSWLLDEVLRSILTPVEPVIMVGYPNGLWDGVNNLPLVRSGLTGSHPLLNWNNKRQFVVDLACFPGSSGSPVFLHETGMFRNRPGSFSPGSRIALLGVLWGGPMITLRGSIEEVTIPTGTQAIPVVNSMMNLGYVVRGDVMLDMEAIARGVAPPAV